MAETITIGPGVLTIGADTALTQFAAQVTACRLVPSVDRSDPIPTLDGGQAPGERTESFALTGTMLQDFGKTDSRTEWLFTHRGEEHPFTYKPTSGTRTVTGTVTVEAIEIGGDARSRPTSDFTFDLVGEPDLGTAA